MITAGRHTLVPDDVDAYDDVEVGFGAFCSIASGLKVVSGQHPGVDHWRVVSNFPFAEHEWGEYPPSRMGGQVTVGNDVWIGQDVNIMVGVTIGDGATVAACSVVTRDVRPYALVAGNPAREKKRRFADPVVKGLLGIAWWDWTDEEIKGCLPEMGDVGEFLRGRGMW